MIISGVNPAIIPLLTPTKAGYNNSNNILTLKFFTSIEKDCGTIFFQFYSLNGHKTNFRFG